MQQNFDPPPSLITTSAIAICVDLVMPTLVGREMGGGGEGGRGERGEAIEEVSRVL